MDLGWLGLRCRHVDSACFRQLWKMKRFSQFSDLEDLHMMMASSVHSFVHLKNCSTRQLREFLRMRMLVRHEKKIECEGKSQETTLLTEKWSETGAKDTIISYLANR